MTRLTALPERAASSGAWSFAEIVLPRRLAQRPPDFGQVLSPSRLPGPERDVRDAALALGDEGRVPGRRGRLRRDLSEPDELALQELVVRHSRPVPNELLRLGHD